MFKPKIFGKYLLIDKIATGGLGEIYKAKTFEALGYEKVIAIKTVRPIYADAKDIIELFQSEALLSVSLDHPNVIRVFDHGKIKDKHFIAMEYIHGSDLKIIMRETQEMGTKIPEEVSVYIIREVCNALDYIHHKNDPRNATLSIVHRDISPANILVSYDGKIKLIDFGVAKSGTKKEEEGVFVGKLRYASPEQVDYKEVDFYSDIFSIGIVLYELLTYKNPFAYEKDEDTITAIKEVHFKPLRDYIPHAHDTIDAIIRKALARNKEDRFERANAFATALTQYIESEGIQNISERFLEFFGTFFESFEKRCKEIDVKDDAKKDEHESTIVSGRKTQKETKGDDDGGTQIIKKGAKKESKNVVVLFVSFTKIRDRDKKELSEDQVQSITNELIKKIMDSVSGYDGAITELARERICAVFGIQGRTTDNALRGIVAAFSVQNAVTQFEEELHIAINLRMTIDTGIVSIDPSVKDIGSFAVSGDSVERGKKLLESARDHAITVSQSIEDYHDIGFKFKDIGSFIFGGVAEKYYEVLERRKKRRDTTQKIEYKTSFVGRKKERKEISQLLTDITKTGQGKAITLYGAVGIGKTRFIRECMYMTPNPYAYYVSAKPELEETFKKNTLYVIFAELLKQVVGIKDSDSDGLIRTKLSVLKDYLLHDHDIYLLGSILGVDFPGNDIEFLEGEERKKEILRSLKDFLVALSGKKTLMYIIDDSEWIDPASAEVLVYIVKDIIKINMFLITISREKSEKNVNFFEFLLPPLSADDTDTMMTTLLPKINGAPDLKKEIHARAEGNPLFIEELCKKLSSVKDLTQKDLLATLTLPKTLEDIFSSRIQGLADTEKQMLRVAACIGKNFRHDILEKMISEDESLRHELAFNLDEYLARLLEEDLIRIDPTKTEPEYVFKHMMLYESVNKLTSNEEKKTYHCLAGEAIEDLFYDRIDDYYGSLVHHFRQAQSFEKVIHYLELVGDRESKNYANDDALKNYRAILEIMSREPLKLKESAKIRKEGAIDQKIAGIYQLIGKWEDGISYALSAIEKAKSINDFELYALSIKTLGRFYKIKGEFDRALDYFREASNVAQNAELKTLKAELTREIGSLYNFKGSYDTALKFIEEGLLEAQKLSDNFLLGRFENDRGIILTKKGQLKEALASLLRSVAYKEKINDKYGMGVTLGNIVEIYYTEEDYAKAREFCEKSIAITEEISDRWGQSVNYYNLGNIYFIQDDTQHAEDSFTKSRAIAFHINWPVGILFNDIFLTYFSCTKKTRKKEISKLTELLDQAIALDAQEGILKARLFLALLYYAENKKKYKKKIDILVHDAKALAVKLNAKDVLKKLEEYIK